MSRPPSFAPPPGARACRLVTERGDFAVIDAPPATGRPHKGTALLLPGYTGSKEDFIALHPHLAAAGYRTVAVDGRGQYESDGPLDDESPYAQVELARDVLAQVAALGTRVHLLGHSLGGQIARAAVLLDHTPFVSLTLMSSGPAQISPSQQQRVKLLQEALSLMDMTEVWEAMQAVETPEDTELDGRPGDPDPAPGPGGTENLRHRWLRNSPAQLMATGRQLCTEPDRVTELSAVPLPKHVLSGERDDTWPVPLLDDMAVRLAAHRTVVRGAEHSPNTDRPQETAAAIAAFWDAC
ncbi:alpha/beta fold hydrolase [Streptomyces jeddahensis]|uniref:2-hydroxy-6-oxononadienedioate/2-hydroxy-6-oxononatrienedioate hydrolase n=1 Tax=Streptomyces jeddahensis TaxID=1716141 RepID=A0A177HM67_9ACTN|nr:alpha/beta hydrolase [Streptomyces jeddahensis]OAH11709.1 2-hydroxy-6-oxononadienedioate/2-hydroxy-6-oxononatrienedioate hydrolase [Streptomyces jeddahensis]